MELHGHGPLHGLHGLLCYCFYTSNFSVESKKFRATYDFEERSVEVRLNSVPRLGKSSCSGEISCESEVLDDQHFHMIVNVK